jgi:hypothetical protein
MELKLLAGIRWKHGWLQDVKWTDWCLDLDVVGTNSFVGWKATLQELPASIKTGT